VFAADHRLSVHPWLPTTAAEVEKKPDQLCETHKLAGRLHHNDENLKHFAPRQIELPFRSRHNFFAVIKSPVAEIFLPACGTF
jgi:hypothetical protein